MRWLLNSTPYEVQLEAMRRGADHPKWGHFLDMGLGKTGVCLNDMLNYLHEDAIQGGVAVVPSYLRGAWREEAEKWQYPVSVTIWPDKVKRPQDPFLLVINTEALLHSGGQYVHDLLKKYQLFMPVDESSCIKNPRSQITSRVMELGQMAARRRALSGLPMTQSVLDLWSQMRYCGALNGINPYQFRNKYAKMGGFMGKKIMGVKEDRLEELQELMASCSFTARKEDWLDLPEKIYPAPLEFTMTDKQRTAYKSMMDEFYLEYEDGEVVAERVIHQMMKLAQVSRGFVKDGDDIIELVEPKKNPAVLATLDAIGRTRGKVIVFTFHEYSTRMLYEQITAAGIDAVVMRGGLKPDDLQRRKQEFNQDSACRVLIGQLSVTNRGHTLLGGSGDDRCSTEIFFENSYSLDVRSQAEDRCHRIGQDRAVVYLDLAGCPMDSKVIAALQQKRDIVDVVMRGIKDKQ